MKTKRIIENKIAVLILSGVMLIIAVCGGLSGALRHTAKASGGTTLDCITDDYVVYKIRTADFSPKDFAWIDNRLVFRFDWYDEGGVLKSDEYRAPSGSFNAENENYTTFNLCDLLALTYPERSSFPATVYYFHATLNAKMLTSPGEEYKVTASMRIKFHAPYTVGSAPPKVTRYGAEDEESDEDKKQTVADITDWESFLDWLSSFFGVAVTTTTVLIIGGGIVVLLLLTRRRKSGT